MRAGQFTERATFYEPRTTQSETGAVKTEYFPVWKCRCSVERFSNTTDKDRQDAREAFFGHFGVIRTRNYPQIKDNMRVEVRGVMYQIILLPPPRHSDNTLGINITKINE